MCHNKPEPPIEVTDQGVDCPMWGRAGGDKPGEHPVGQALPGGLFYTLRLGRIVIVNFCVAENLCSIRALRIWD